MALVLALVLVLVLGEHQRSGHTDMTLQMCLVSPGLLVVILQHHCWQRAELWHASEQSACRGELIAEFLLCAGNLAWNSNVHARDNTEKISGLTCCSHPQSIVLSVCLSVCLSVYSSHVLVDG